MGCKPEEPQESNRRVLGGCGGMGEILSFVDRGAGSRKIGDGTKRRRSIKRAQSRRRWNRKPHSGENEEFLSL